MWQGDMFVILKSLTESQYEQFCEYFQDAPAWLIDKFIVEKIKKDKLLIRTGESVDTVYYLLKGVVKATDHHVKDTSFDFMIFDSFHSLGGMEVIMGKERYLASLQTITDCMVLKIPSILFDQWIKSDIQILYRETIRMSTYLLEQTRFTRLFLFLGSADRLALLLKYGYEKYAQNGIW